MHGKIMLPLATLVSLNAFIGEMNPTIDFHVFAYVDVSLKMLFGILLLRSGSITRTGMLPLDLCRG
ncbi:DUF6609 family protein [Brevibacillus sp. HB1.4B]|uniref:DUF6609 family protein n=1 Tax=Brevibacillus sp. HB1.4B TaxID=2738845 RepID=UPI00352EB5CE